MRKREQQQQPQPQPQAQPQQTIVGGPSFYMDIFEPPPQWRTSVNNNTSSINYHAHSPTHRSPIHHQPSLSEIVYQEFNGPSEIQDAYPGVYQQDRLSQQQHQLHHQRSQQFQQQQQQQQQLQQLQLKQHQEHIQLKQQLQHQLQQQHQHQHQQIQEQNHHHQHHHHSRANSIGSAHDFESAASSLYTISTSPHYLQYDDVDDDNESVDKSMFRNHNHNQQQQHRHQADNISIATSLFTAVEHLENDSAEEDDEEEEHYDDNSSTENQRHGYLPSSTVFQEQKSQQQQVSINDLMKKLDIRTSVEWEDYKPQYRLLNESYDSVKQEIYKEIYATMQKMQELDYKFNTTKATFHSAMEKNYEQMSNQLVSQCEALTTEQNEYKNKLKSDETNKEYLPKSEKIRLNVGGSMFETSLSTLRRDTSSLLATMFSGRHLISAESDGSYFIDRDPSHFRLVLNYLRDLRIPPTILQDTKICQELLQEAKYYSIEGLIKILQQQHL